MLHHWSYHLESELPKEKICQSTRGTSDQRGMQVQLLTDYLVHILLFSLTYNFIDVSAT